jgi:Glycosyl transferase family 11
MGPFAADLFVHVHPRNFQDVLHCVESIRSHLGNGCGRVCVVTAGLPTEIRQKLEAIGCEFLQKKDVFGFDASAIPGEVEARERLFAQLLKWELRRFSSTPTYLVVDADCRLNRSTGLWRENQQVLFCENRFRFGYLLCFNYFFGQYPAPTSPASSEIQHFDKAVLDEMVEKIQGRYKTHWAQATFAILREVRGTAFDAGQNYGHYLGIFRPGSYAVEAYQSARTDSVPSQPGVVRMGTLGFNGRFANQLFQYAYLRKYASREGLAAECLPWIGCSLFGHQNRFGENSLPVYRQDQGDTQEMIRFDPQQHLKDIELWGYFQDPQHWAENPDEFRDLFQPLPFLKKPLDEAVGRLRNQNQTLVAIHLRRGDFSGGPNFWPAPEAWYLNWLEQIWPTLVNPVLYVATDDPKNVLPQFAGYSAKSTADLNVTVNGAEYYSDFYVLSQCDVLGISNSTFSFAAAMMNTTAKKFFRPDPVHKQMVAFNPWKSQVQLRKPETALISIAA